MPSQHYLRAASGEIVSGPHLPNACIAPNKFAGWAALRTGRMIPIACIPLSDGLLLTSRRHVARRQRSNSCASLPGDVLRSSH
jgi:hypothetical protein